MSPKAATGAIHECAREVLRFACTSCAPEQGMDDRGTARLHAIARGALLQAQREHMFLEGVRAFGWRSETNVQ